MHNRFIKYIFIICIAINIASNIYGQGIIESINNSYKLLDTAQYIEDIKPYVYNDIETERKEMNETTLELVISAYYKKTVVDSVKRIFIMDSLMNYTTWIIPEEWTKIRYNDFLSILNNVKKMEFVLNLHIEKDTVNGNYSLKPDTGKFPFSVYFFDKYPNPYYIVTFEKGEYRGYGELIVHSRKDAKIIAKAYKQIMKKNPKYFLYSRELDVVRWGRSSEFYVLNDKIYVYRPPDKKEYELEDYIKKYPPKGINYNF